MFLLFSAIVVFVIIYQKRLQKQKALLQEKQLLHQKAMVNSMIEAQENERQRIAGNLHDEIGAMLSTLKLSFDKTIKTLNKPDDIEQSHRTKKLLDEAIEKTRNISHELLPNSLKLFGLDEAIKNILEKLEENSDIKVKLEKKYEKRAELKVELALFRITQELLNNTIKHAEAKNINIILENNETELLYIFSDDGKGFDFEFSKYSKDSGLGIHNVQSRAQAINAELDVQSDSNGTTFKISLPA